MKKIAVLTSGGDAPGMNTRIRSVVRTALSENVDVVGIKEGYDGLIGGEFVALTARDVGGIIHQGGTILQTARCEEFYEHKGRLKALRQLREYDIEGLIVIGGDGSLRGAQTLVDMDFPVVTVPASIDNDIWGTNMSLGVDTALNTITDAIDKLRDTASSHQRAFLIETMGRDSGYLALMGGLISGAEMVLIPEISTDLEDIGSKVENAYARGKTHCIIVMAEGTGLKTYEVAEYLKIHEVGFNTRVTILGHLQRGGRPSAFDRLLATRMGVKAARLLLRGETGIMVGLRGRDIEALNLKEVIENKRQINLDYYEMAHMLAL